MDIVHFIGFVHPKSWHISAPYSPEITWDEPDLNFKAKFSVQIMDSKVTVKCEVPKFDLAQLDLLLVRALDQARIPVNLAAFANGVALVVLFDSVRLPDGAEKKLSPVNPDLAKLCTAFKVSDNSFIEMYNIALSKPDLFLALGDLIEAITHPHMASINCGRVIDGIRRIVAPGLDAKAGWAKMHSALNVARPYQEWISKLSTNPRHADRTFIPGADATQAVERTWNIMNRLFEYLKRGAVPLTALEFPELN